MTSVIVSCRNKCLQYRNNKLQIFEKMKGLSVPVGRLKCTAQCLLFELALATASLTPSSISAEGPSKSKKTA